MIGTQSLRSINEIQLVEYDDETNTLSKCIYEHNKGEIWHINSSPSNKLKFLTCYNSNGNLIVGKIWYQKYFKYLKVRNQLVLMTGIIENI